MKKEQGFSLIEALAALVIVSIVLLSFSQFFVQSNKTAVRNNEQLVVTYLANAELERAKNAPSSELFSAGKLSKPAAIFSDTYSSNFEKSVTINNQSYKIRLTATQSSDEHDIKFVTLTVKVVSPDMKTNSSVEGIVKYE